MGEKYVLSENVEAITVISVSNIDNDRMRVWNKGCGYTEAATAIRELTEYGEIFSLRAREGWGN